MITDSSSIADCRGYAAHAVQACAQCGRVTVSQEWGWISTILDRINCMVQPLYL